MTNTNRKKGVEYMYMPGIAGMFEPARAAVNLIGLAKTGLLIAGFCCGGGLFLRSRLGAAIGSIMAAILLFYLLDSGQYYSLGREMARILTIITN